jgi:hypothetical protein
MAIREATSTPVLLRGPSARAWSRAMFVVWPIVIVAVLALAITVSLPSSSFGNTLVDMLMGLVLVCLPVGIIGGSLIRQRETEGGYTTLRNAHRELSQLDPRTGDVVREAGDLYIGLGPAPMAAVTVHQPEKPARSSTLRRLLPTIPLVVFGFGTIVLAALRDGRLTSAAPGIATIFAVVVVLSLVVALRSARTGRGLLERIASMALGDFVFRFTTLGDFDLVGHPHSFLDGVQQDRHFGASANAAGIRFWDEHAAAPIGELAWTSVSSIRVTGGSDIYGVGQVLRIGFTSESGEMRTVSLQLPNVSALSLGSSAEAEWVAAELDKMRQANTAN